jgi:hypothetical protein
MRKYEALPRVICRRYKIVLQQKADGFNTKDANKYATQYLRAELRYVAAGNIIWGLRRDMTEII